MRIPMILAGAMLAACDGGGSAASAPASNPPPAADVIRIAAVQGRGPVSPLEEQAVTVRGTVTGDFQDGDPDRQRSLGGFYLQDDPPDTDPETSDGVFVFDGDNPAVDVDTGDVVEVHGAVTEHFGETQIAATRVRVVGRGTVLPFPLILPVGRSVANGDGDPIADLERYEGMLVKLAQQLSVTDLRNLERYGTVTLSAEGRLFQYTNFNAPDAAGYAAHRDAIARRSIVLDDGLRTGNPLPVPYLRKGDAADYSLRVGDAVSGLTGNLRYSRGSGGNGVETWRLVPTGDVRFEALNPRPGAPAVGGTLRVASVNVLNLFSTIDTGETGCGPRGDVACRGADSVVERDRQVAKTVTAMALLDADIIGLVELENNADASLRLLVDALNARLGAGQYRWLDTGVIHDDAIKTGFIYRQASVTAVGGFALLDRSVDSRFNDARNRPALAQTFRQDNNGATLTVVVNHLKSKGSPCDADGDTNTGDGQGNCNLTRTNAAAALADWVATDPTGSGDPDVLIIGDLNAYMEEDPLAALAGAGFTNLLDARNRPYSFVFDGQAGALDHAIASPSLVPQVVGAMEWHVNADEPPVLDYNLEHGRDPSLFDATIPYRASDHDPVVIGLELTN